MKIFETSMTDTLEKARTLIKEGKLDAAFHQILLKTANTSYETLFVQLNAQWSTISTLHRNGQMSLDEYLVVGNRITGAFLAQLDEIEATLEPAVKPTIKPNHLSIEGKTEADIMEKALIDFYEGVLDLPKDPEKRAIYVHFWTLLVQKNIQRGRE